MVRHVCDRVVVMYRGQVMEIASAEDIFFKPEHPYTQALISAVPVPDPGIESHRKRLTLIQNMQPSNLSDGGCVYRMQCDLAREECVSVEPRIDLEDEHGTACHFRSESVVRFSVPVKI